jgi:mono/diheme cytochrome c family protein
MRSKTYASLSIAALCAAILPEAFAQRGPANPQRGRELAARLCTGCHVIDRVTSGPVRADVPSFPAIAERAGSTAEHLAGRIIVPHPAMPGVALTADEIRDIVAYIVTLKRTD